MYINFFKTIRENYFTGTFLTCLLSNVIVFGQPINQISQRVNQLEIVEGFHFTYVDNSSSNINDYKSSALLPKSEKSLKKNNAITFYAIEDEGVIGSLTLEGKENPHDNFFTIMLPETINLNKYDVLLKYNLFGLENANQTTKSINNASVYGGQSVKINKGWSEVSEYIPTRYINSGKNEIFFNRRSDENYWYKIKDLSIELIHKSQAKLFLLNSKLKNFNGKVHLVGYASKEVSEVSVYGNNLLIKDGVFEHTLENVTKETKFLKFSYENKNGNIEEKFYDIDYSKEDLDFKFQESTEIKNFNQLNNSTYINHEAFKIEITTSKGIVNKNNLSSKGLYFKELRPLNIGMENVTFGDYLGYRIKTNKKEDSLNVKLHLKFDEAKIPDGYSVKDIRTFSFDKDKREWVALPVDSLDFKNKLIISKFNGDTDYINGVIKVPEMAETSSFTPTTIADIKYADPSAGVVSIAPPSPTNNGSTTTSFPIKLPAGRGGMQPSLDVSYNSEAGNGWMGVGWDLQLPSITLDTRWGVPRFDPIYESEMYLFNGEPLVQKIGSEYTNPHRYEGEILRNTSGYKRFYLRKEGGYQTIIRHGNSPKNYTWVVTDKFGDEQIYGLTASTRINNNSSLNRTHWALYKTIDPFGNAIQYHYNQGSVMINGVLSQFFYPTWILYTIKQGNSIDMQNYYRVDFKRNTYSIDSMQTLSREDITLTARTGVVMAMNDLLTEIQVSYIDNNNSQSKIIRTYRFNYKETAFKKMQLSEVSEYDTNDELFYTNSMDYYDDIGNYNSTIINSSSINWNSSKTNLESTLHTITPSNTITEGSALGTSTSNGFAFGLRGAVGIGTNPTNVTGTAGASLSYSQSTEKNKISLLDINGDGLPDKIYKSESENKLFYKPNLGLNNSGSGQFGITKEFLVIDDLDETKVRTNGSGFDVNVSIIGAGTSKSKTRTNTDGYFSDINGDGLPDIIKNGAVSFNTISPWEGTTAPNISNNNNSGFTANPITNGAINLNLLNSIDLPSLQDLQADHNQFDHLKVWRAPFKGKIDITGFAQLVNMNFCGSGSNAFKLTIEKANSNLSPDTAALASFVLSNSSSPPTQINKFNLNVNKGDYVFFRSHNINYGCGGEVEWNPNIEYNFTDNISSEVNDEHGLNLRTYNAKNDFSINNGGGLQIPQSTNNVDVRFNLPTGNFSPNQFSDDINFIIEKIKTTYASDGSVISEEVDNAWTRTYNVDGNLSGSLNLITGENTNSSGGTFIYTFRCYANSDSNVQWNQIDWQPTIVSISDSQTLYPGVTYKIYDNNINESEYWINNNVFNGFYIDSTLPNNANALLLSHNAFDDLDYTQFNELFDDGLPIIKINWVVKEKYGVNDAKLLHKKTFFVSREFNGWTYNYMFRTAESDGDIINPTNPYFAEYFQHNLTKEKVLELKNNNGRLFSAFYTDSFDFGLNNPTNITLGLHPDQESTNVFSPQILTSPFIVSNNLFYGVPYRGWGQLLYNGGITYNYDSSDTLTSIDNYDGLITTSIFNEILDSSISSSSNAIRYLFYEQDNQNQSYTNKTIKFLQDTSVKYGYNGSLLTTTLGRFAENNLYDLYTDFSDFGTTSPSIFPGVKQFTFSKGTANTGNLGVGPVGGSATISNASSKILNQYIDLNGDRYPDLITDSKIQFTNMKGGYMAVLEDNDFTSGSKSYDETYGANISGMFPNSTAGDNNKVVKNTTRTNINSGLSSSLGNTFGVNQWNDINGDGLTDKVLFLNDQIIVRLNTGYGFTSDIIWGEGYGTLFSSKRSSDNFSLGGGVSVTTNSSWAAGLGTSSSTSYLEAGLIDVNGDGLPDLVKKIGLNYVYFINKGNQFVSTSQILSNEPIDQDYSVAGNIFGSATTGVTIPIPPLGIPFKIIGTLSFSPTAGVSEKRISFQDINGDGLSDIIKKGSNNGNIIAKLNKVGRTNLLRSVNTPLGGSWTIDYKREGNTYDMPNSQWTLHKIFTHDGFTGADADSSFGPDETLITINYENGKYDRREREFLGFEKIRVDEKDILTETTYRYSVMEYYTDNIYLKGLSKRTSSYDSSDIMLSESKTLYNIMNPISPQTNLNSTAANQYLQVGVSPINLDQSRLFVAPVKTINTVYENGQSLSTEQHFLNYDNYGNLLTYKNLGDVYASVNDAYRTEMEYFTSIAGVANSKGFVKKINIYRHHDNQLLRQREIESYDLGKPTKIKTKLNNTDTNSVLIEYDDYGNAIKTTSESGFVTNITFENNLNTYPINVYNSFGYTSSSEYDYLFGIPILSTDTNGQKLRTRIDDRGRIIEVTAPNEMPNGWTIRMEYEGESETVPTFNDNNYMVNAVGSFQPGAIGITQFNAKHHAVTRHNVLGAINNQLLTVSLIDGLGKPIQLKKTLFENQTGSGQLKWLISGKEKRDDFGRVIKAYLPTVQMGYPTDTSSLSSAFNYITDTPVSIGPTEMAYDVRDRMISVTQPNESESSTVTFDIVDGMFLTTSNNELDQTYATFTDVRGRQRKTIQNDELITQFYYNAIGEKIRVRNHQGYETFYKYDLAGRRLEERHPDRGLTQFEYDSSNNLVKRYTSNLLSSGSLPINYQYDYNRLKEINYPLNPENDVKYIYGDSLNNAASVNAIGRLFMQEDASGVQGFGYDKLGNLNNHLRGVAVAGRHTFWYHTQWEYDSHNRVNKITYPDKEEVVYNYNSGGALDNISRSISATTSVPLSQYIVQKIRYNNLGERTEVKNGNGTSTLYTYDNRRRIKDLSHNFTGFNVKNAYSYDVLSNVTQLNTVDQSNTLPAIGQIGGPVSHNYTYDNYNRLVSANGRYTGPNDFTTPLLAQEYTLNMVYDLSHNIVSKTQTHVQGPVNNYNDPISSPETMIKTNYHLDYGGYAEGLNVVEGLSGEYGYVQPHAPREIIETPNQTTDSDDPTYKKKVIDYDANGNQTVTKQILFEGEQAPAYEGIVETKSMTLNKNLWDEENRLRAVDLNPDDASEHPLAVYTYDAGGQRIVRYIPGRLDVRSNATNVSSNQRDEVMLYPSPLITAKALSKPGVEPQEGDLVSNYTKHYYIGSQRINSTIGTARDLGLFPEKLDQKFTQIRGLANLSVLQATSGLNHAYEELQQPITLIPSVIEEIVSRYTHDPTKYDAYWYHSDHLGSSSYISNRFGVVSQHMEYLPFGETLVDEHLNSYNTPYKFNGKELDDETGNYYYGARYYNPKTSIWLGVDPLAEKMPEWSSYNYVFSNPVRLTDPSGMAPEWKPVVNDDGSTSYVAEQGDDVQSFVNQYGVTYAQAKELLNGNEHNIQAGITEVSGQDVFDMNPYNSKTRSEVLKLKKGTSQQKFDQLVYSMDHSRSKDNISFELDDYFVSTTSLSGKVNFDIDGVSHSLVMDIDIGRPATFDGSGNYRLDNSPLTTKQTSGTTYPNEQENIFIRMNHPTTGNYSGQNSVLYTTRSSANAIFDRLSKEIPEYNYIKSPTNIKD